MKILKISLRKVLYNYAVNRFLKKAADLILGRESNRKYTRRFLQVSSLYLLFLPMCVASIYAKSLSIEGFMALLSLLGSGLTVLYAALRSGIRLPASDKGLVLGQFGLSQILIVVACSSNAWLHSVTVPFLSLMILLAMWRFSAGRLKIALLACLLSFSLVELVWIAKGDNNSAIYLLPLLGLSYWVLKWLARDVVNISSVLSRQNRDIKSIGGNFLEDRFIDSVSQMLSRHQLAAVLSRECKRQLASRVGFSIAYIRFHSDEANVEAGPRMAGHFGEVLKIALRRSDICMKFEENVYIVVLPATGRIQAIFALQRIRLMVTGRLWNGYSFPGRLPYFTAACAFHSSIESIDDTMARLLFCSEQARQDGPFVIRAI